MGTTLDAQKNPLPAPEAPKNRKIQLKTGALKITVVSVLYQFAVMQMAVSGN